MKRRKGLAFILALSLVLSSFSVAFATDVAEETTPVTETTTEAVAPVATATNTAFADIAGHWAKDAIVKWADYGVVKGSDGVFRPDAPLTRAEMATVLSNLMDYKVAAKNNFSDVATGAWYADAVLKANAAGVLSGDGSGLASPSANITREQATSMLARAFAVADANGTSSSLTDTQNISSWARPAVFGMEAAGYVRGFEGKFNPKNNITRAEVITIINSAVKAYYTAAGTYTENVDGLAVVKVPGVVLKDVVISGNLIAAEGIASGDLTLDGKTEVKGKLIVRGGGENSIIIKGSAAVLSIEVSKVDGKVRIFADGALIKEITALKGEIILEGNFTNVEVKADATVIIKGNVGTLSMENKGTVDIQSGTVTTLDIPAGATATIAANATVTTANITGAADIKGTGAIGTANISGTGATIVQTPTAVNIADGGAATVGGKTVDGATSAAPSTGGGSGGGGNSSNTVAVSAISVKGTGDATTITTDNGTLQILPTVTPDNASNKAVTWTVTETDGTATDKATISNTGLLTAVKNGTVKVTATAKDGSGKSGFANIEISGQEPPAYASTKKLTNATVSVANGTSEADAKAALDKTVGVVGTKGETGTANIAWTIASYDGNTLGEYLATGVLTLPTGWTGTAGNVTATVRVTKANVPSSMTLGSSTLNSTNPYLVDGKPATTGTLGADKCTARFDSLTGVLSLQDYVGGVIRIDEAGKDLRIKLIGNENKITGGQFGIYNNKGDIYITSDNEASLEIEINSSSDGAAIANGWGAMTENPSVFIGGKVKLTIKAEYTGGQTTNSITGIYAGKGSVIIQDQADYSATLTNSKYQGRGIFSNGKTIINTSGNIGIDVSNSAQGIGIYGIGGIEIQKVNSMLITIPSTGGTNTKFTSGTVDVSSGVAVNKSTTKASYRSGTPYTLGLEGGNITSATGGVIGSTNHQYLVDDEITIQSTIAESNFDRWTKADGTALETSLFTGSDTAESATATIKMPAANLSIKAKEKDAKISIAEIPGVTAPVTGATPVTTEVSTDQYTGTVAWSPTDNPFAAEKVYTATITLKAKSGFTLDGVAANFFTVAGATTVTNAANTGVVAAVFAKTVALSNDAALTSSIGTVDNTANTIVDVPYATTLEVFKAAITPATGATFKVYQADGTTEATDLASGYKVIVTAQDTTTTKTYTVTVEIGEFAGGLGTVGSPYQVSNAEQLNKVRNHLDKHFIQTADIDLSTYTTYGGWQPIGNTTTRFAGKYNGNNFNISNLTINRPDAEGQGLFGYITYGSVLENISLTTVNVEGKHDVGGLVGYFNNGTITSCNVLGTVNGQNYVGGLVGRQGYGTITSSYTSGTVKGTDIVGGLVGGMGSGDDVKVTNSYSLASVEATADYGRVGGLVGLNQKAIENCYAAGQVTGKATTVGGLVGQNNGTITSSYYDSTITTQSDTGKGVGKTTAEMKQAATFTGWDTSIWNITDGSYPTLK